MTQLTPHRLQLSNKLARAVWGLVQTLLIRPSPRPAHRWRRFWLACFGARIDPSCLVYNSVRIWAPWNLKMAPGAVIGEGAEIYNVALVSLGSGAVVSQRAFLCTASHDYAKDDFTLVAGEITLGEGAWVASEAYVAPGVSIGAFAILGARSVATSNVPAGQILAGNPARLVGPRPPVKTRPGDILSGVVDSRKWSA